ncbi:uncharacterized protein F5Z01DRAFT_306948 [Emericellopsis atlantica]|uniref:Uncharacterized protein n=1 Tax=Emericellopsis atlantica TaxID=2614577 RepID=A0A9P8CSI5_9HYPO|nr:uncharacterized protein F5Z01DRAFT_306948 [Emericellopsis atlantica]KAG9257863.1 hypothetical protein F5Z01DRAFT_306948 [Emericellopsis atlantica]
MRVLEFSSLRAVAADEHCWRVQDLAGLLTPPPALIRHTVFSTIRAITYSASSLAPCPDIDAAQLRETPSEPQHSSRGGLDTTGAAQSPSSIAAARRDFTSWPEWSAPTWQRRGMTSRRGSRCNGHRVRQRRRPQATEQLGVGRCSQYATRGHSSVRSSRMRTLVTAGNDILSPASMRSRVTGRSFRPHSAKAPILPSPWIFRVLL